MLTSEDLPDPVSIREHWARFQSAMATVQQTLETYNALQTLLVIPELPTGGLFFNIPDRDTDRPVQVALELPPDALEAAIGQVHHGLELGFTQATLAFEALRDYVLLGPDERAPSPEEVTQDASVEAAPEAHPA